MMSLMMKRVLFSSNKSLILLLICNEVDYTLFYKWLASQSCYPTSSRSILGFKLRNRPVLEPLFFGHLSWAPHSLPSFSWDELNPMRRRRQRCVRSVWVYHPVLLKRRRDVLLELITDQDAICVPGLVLVMASINVWSLSESKRFDPTWDTKRENDEPSLVL